MSVQLKEINVTYVPKEDRLLVKISDSDDEECRIWLTRRFTKILLEALDKVLMAESRAQGAVTKEAQSAFAEYQHSQNVNDDSFAHNYQQETGQPALGKEDMLAHTIEYKSLSNGGLEFSILSDGDKKATLNMDDKMKHQFYELVQRGIVMASWDKHGLSITGSPELTSAVH